jgi:glucose-6-phosphate isomerase
MINDAAMQARLQRLIVDGAVGQLRRRDGLMARLGSEDGALKLDWVEGIGRLLDDPAKLEEVEAEARAIRNRGIRHIIWAGMGGSVLTVRVLRDLGFCGGHADVSSSQRDGEQIAIRPLDSTDPAALNAIIRAIAAAKRLALPTPAAGEAAAFLRSLLQDVMMVGVAMGMTSEEPITHLTWFTDLLEQAGLSPAEHILVMTLPGSYLDIFAQEHHAPSRPLQLDGASGTGGRMSAPATRVFLLPAALYLTGLSAEAGQLRAALQSAWDAYDLDLATTHPAQHPFVQLAAALSAASDDGACRVLLRMPDGWQVFVSWLEQLMEESLGKGGKGIVVFDDQPLNASSRAYRREGMLRVHILAEAALSTSATDEPLFTLSQPALASANPQKRLSALAASFLGWQLTMALYGYLQRIQFAGQPAVENYKARARALRTQPDPLGITAQWQPALHDGNLTLLAPTRARLAEQAPAFAEALHAAVAAGDSLGYLDVTINGEAPPSLLAMLDERIRTIGNTLLGVPVKLRQAPAAYHSTEQGEMDGPPYLVSLRLVARESETCLVGSYTNTFLHAQAVSTWQAMMEAGRPCFLLVVDGALADAAEPLTRFFAQVEQALTM